MWKGIIETGIKLQSKLLPSEFVGLNAVFAQTVRFERRLKPWWFPPAKSRLFKIHPRVQYPKEEREEVLRLFNQYRTYRKAIKQHFIKIVAENEVQYSEENVKKNEELDFVHCSQVNEEWNRQVALQRDERLTREWEKTQIVINQIKTEKDAVRAKKLAEEAEYIRKLKEEEPTFITRETLDQAIDTILESKVDYNSAIDTSGDRYYEIIDKVSHRDSQINNEIN